MASITCRNGETFPAKHTHDSVAAVRQCQGAPSTWESAPRTHVARNGLPHQFGEQGPQNVYLNRTNHACRVEETVQARAHLSEFAPKLATGLGYRVDPELESKVPDGRYAIQLEGTVKFYRVRKVTKGIYAGRTFVDRQAGDESFPVRFATERAKILTAIAADVKVAAIRYGKALGKCSQCGRTLTNPESIALGIGPVCLSRLS